ncbi:MAG TPA: hypothetical protein PLO51_03040, partial [Candidatus Micrarchaeota archaeon]|nr:hypothetical protein [Candidatus Micrarchaeota archaeon]
MSKPSRISMSFPAILLAFFLISALSFAADPLTTSAATANNISYSYGSWATSPVNVTLVCVNGSTDCSGTYYCIDTTNTCNPTSNGTQYNGTINITAEGVSYIRFASNNSTGGWGDTDSAIIKIDTAAPSISFTNGPSGSWTNDDTISVSVSDSGSGVANTVWIASPDSTCGPSKDSALNSGTGGTTMEANNDTLYQNKHICFRSKDVAGNSNYAVSSQITRLDTTPPSVNAGSDLSANSQFTQNGAASDSGSGISSYSWSMASGPGAITFGSPNSQSTTVSASVDGIYVITLTAIDAAGNSGSGSFTLHWITSAPGISISNPGANPAVSKTVSASVPSGA